MSLATEWFLAIHRAFWFPVLYLMGLERASVEVMDKRFRYTALSSVPTQTGQSRRRATKRKTG